MTSAESVSIVVPSQTTPQTAIEAKEAISALMGQIDDGTPVHLSCSDGPPSVLALQLCHAAQTELAARGAIVTLDDGLTAQLTPSPDTRTTDVQAGATA